MFPAGRCLNVAEANVIHADQVACLVDFYFIREGPAGGFIDVRHAHGGSVAAGEKPSREYERGCVAELHLLLPPPILPLAAPEIKSGSRSGDRRHAYRAVIDLRAVTA
jgi:hypothetical protein